MTELRFTVEFLSPFAVSTGQARDGLDTTVNLEEPLPATALKGLLKAHLRDTLGAPPAVLTRIFTSGDTLRWVFGEGQAQVSVNAWARVKVDDEGRAAERHLMVGEQAYATTGSFSISGKGRVLRQKVRCWRFAQRHGASLPWGRIDAEGSAGSPSRMISRGRVRTARHSAPGFPRRRCPDGPLPIYPDSSTPHLCRSGRRSWECSDSSPCGARRHDSWCAGRSLVESLDGGWRRRQECLREPL